MHSYAVASSTPKYHPNNDEDSSSEEDEECDSDRSSGAGDFFPSPKPYIRAEFGIFSSPTDFPVRDVFKGGMFRKFSN